MKVSRNQAFSGQATFSTTADTLDPDNPVLLGKMVGPDPVTYNPNPVSPGLGGGTNVDLTNLTTSGATPGIYALWLKGQAGAPYLTTKYVPLSFQIGAVAKDFSILSDAATKDAPVSGNSVTFTLTLLNSPSKNVDFGGPVTLSVDNPTLPTGVGSIGFSKTTVTPSKTGDSSTLTINTGTLPANNYTFTVRATGLNGDLPRRKVTRLLNLTVRVAPTSASSDQYVDIVGFAVMRITAMDANTISAYAITPMIADPNDPRLLRGQVAKLVPWS
jgi:hypothetical protein